MSAVVSDVNTPLLPCVVCGLPTDYRCADCAALGKPAAPLCTGAECIDAHGVAADCDVKVEATS